MMRLSAVTNYLLLTIGSALLIASCQKGDDKPIDPTDKASFDLLQERILTTNCALSGCHASQQDGSFNQHRLVLAKESAFENLVGVASTNALAKEDGMLRVKPFNAMESLLFHKLTADASHHNGKQYGNLMPLGREPLTVGQIEFVRRWIEAGAPKTGSVVDVALLDDKTPSVGEFEALLPPATGQGFQMKVDPFNIQPNFEREIFVRKMIGNQSDIYVKRIQIKMRTNSHHLLVHSFKSTNSLPQLNQIRDVRNPDGSLNLDTYLSMQNHVFAAGSQTTTFDYTFPEGAALPFTANTSLDLNSHYVNKSTQPIVGEAYVNFYTVNKAQVQHVLKTIDFGNTGLNLPAKQRTTAVKSFTFDKNVRVLTLTSHMHKLGEKFVIKIYGGARNGEVVYTSNDWQHPDIINLKNPISLKAGEGFTSEITYNNTTDKTVQFGLSSEEEMGIIFGYYYEE
ncbi:monooxygenase [Tellurirhabdus bombi]|uniref:monooxygenase n=1 Tax=Tellurirhabdus bombi TaxID=2907205 RepID=UPI001F369279|nr:hypothetical protein [Tellurirhabdus bombi]